MTESFHVELGADLIASRLAAYESLLRDWNARQALVSPLGLERFRDTLLQPCLQLARIPALVQAESIVDLGSGNGLPGLPVAITHPHLPILLVDSQLRRCRFLLEVVSTLELDRVRVRHDRVEKIRDEASPSVFISRFFKDLRLVAAWTRRWRSPGTRYLFFAGEEQTPQPEVYDLTLCDRHPLGAGKVALEYLVR